MLAQIYRYLYYVNGTVFAIGGLFGMWHSICVSVRRKPLWRIDLGQAGRGAASQHNIGNIGGLG